MNLPPSLQAQLDALARALRLIRAGRGIALCLAAAAIALAALIHILSRVDLAPPVPSRTLTALLALTVAELIALLAWAFASPLPRRAVARLVESSYPDLQDRLLAVVDPATAEAALASAGLMACLRTRIAQRLQPEDLRRVANWPSLRRAALCTLVAALTLGMTCLTCPEGFARLTGNVAVATPAAHPHASAKPPAEARAEPGLYDLAVELTPPAYTGLAPSRLTDDFDRITVLRGTRVTISAQPAEGSSLTVSLDRAPSPLPHTFAALRDVAWRLSATRDGRRLTVGPFRIRVTPDRAPEVRLIQPGHDLTLDSVQPVALEVSARDDFGVAELAILYRRQRDTSWRSLPLPAGDREVTQTLQFDLAPMALKPGEAVEIRALARDNDTVSGPKTTLTRIVAIALRGKAPEPPTPEAVQEAQQQETGALEKLQAEAQAFDQQLQELVQRAQASEAAGVAPQISKGALQEAQERLAQRAQDVRQAMAQAEQSLDQSPLISDEMVQKVQELHQLMAELMNEDLKQVMEKVNEALKQLGTKQLTQTLEEAREAQRKFMEKLDRALSLLRKAKLEAQLEALKQYVQQLADRQEKLQQRTETLKDGDRSSPDVAAQEKLAKDTAPVNDQIAKLGEAMTQENEQIAADLRNLAAELADADPAAQMRQAAAALDRAQPARATPSQARAQAALRDAAARLAQAAADITAKERKDLTNAANRLTRDALTLSRGQEQALNQTRPLASPNRYDLLQQKRQLSDLKRRQDSVRQGTSALAGQIGKLARQTPVVEPSLAHEAQRLADQMARAGSEIEAGETPSAYARQIQAMAGLNDLARDLMKLSDQLNKTSAQMALQEYMKRMEELAQRQKGLNREMGGEPQEGGEQPGGDGQGGAPVPMPGPGSMGEMAMEQAMIRQALQKMLQGKGAGKMVDQLGGVPAQMEKSEDEMRGGAVNQQTLLRQRDILHKMLDAQRSLYSKQKESKERKAEAPKAYKAPASPPILRPDQTRAPQVKRQRKDLSRQELPLDYEDITRAFLERAGSLRR